LITLGTPRDREFNDAPSDQNGELPLVRFPRNARDIPNAIGIPRELIVRVVSVRVSRTVSQSNNILFVPLNLILHNRVLRFIFVADSRENVWIKRAASERFKLPNLTQRKR
jgi:hypothetical protein